MDQHIFIKGMVCERCVNVIRQKLEQMGLCITNVTLGKVSFCRELNQKDQEQLVSFLMEKGFQTMSNRNTRLVHQVKELINQHLLNNQKKIKLSAKMSEALHMKYDSISEIFSASEGITLEKYIINKRLEKVKELLVYTDKSLTEIAHLISYSSINHLSRQFRETEGIPPSHYRQIRFDKLKVKRQPS